MREIRNGKEPLGQLIYPPARAGGIPAVLLSYS